MTIAVLPEQMERPSLHNTLQESPSGPTQHNAMDRGWTGAESFAQSFAKPLPPLVLLRDSSAEWGPIETVGSRELDVQKLDHDGLHESTQNWPSKRT